MSELEQIVNLFGLVSVKEKLQKTIKKTNKKIVFQIINFVITIVVLIFLFSNYGLVKRESLDRACREIIPESELDNKVFYDTLDCEKGSEIIKIGKGTHINGNKD